MTDLLLRNVRPDGGERCDILIKNGKIAGIGQKPTARGMAVEDGGASHRDPA